MSCASCLIRTVIRTIPPRRGVRPITLLGTWQHRHFRRRTLSRCWRCFSSGRLRRLSGGCVWWCGWSLTFSTGCNHCKQKSETSDVSFHFLKLRLLIESLNGVAGSLSIQTFKDFEWSYTGIEKFSRSLSLKFDLLQSFVVYPSSDVKHSAVKVNGTQLTGSRQNLWINAIQDCHHLVICKRHRAVRASWTSATA
jgi:hypothetical protein